MRLKSLELYGFKSFAEKTTLQFHDDFVAVVGPNGSGKSNLSDAVRWVLGEQSAGALRGTRMEDVIFNGTDKKAPMNIAQVVLVFDNTDGDIPLPYEEVSVARKVYRNGEGQYFLNSQQVRRKDIHELFLNTGVGKEGYSIIGQGRIDEILSTRGEDRRSVFEEAAGIARYKYKKTESEQRLARTEQQLETVRQDVHIKEQEAHLMKRQAENAKTGRRLMQELDQHELSLLKAQRDAADERISQMDADITLHSETVAELQKQNEMLEEQLRPYESFVQEWEEKRSVFLEKKGRRERDIQQEETRLSVAQEKIQFYRQDLSRLDSEEQNAKANAQALQIKIQDEEKEEERLRQALKKVDEELANLSVEDSMSGKEITQKRIHAEEEVRRFQESLSVLRYRREEAEKAREDLQKQQKEQQTLTDALEGEVNALLEKKEKQEALLQEHLQAQATIQKALGICEEDVRHLLEEADHLAETKRTGEAKRAGIASQEKMLRALMQQYEGYQRSVQNLLKIADRETEVKARLIGPLADLLQVKKGYETAVEVALGGALQNVVVESEKDAKALIALLKERKLGRVTFLPLDRIAYASPMVSDAKEALCNGTEAVEYDNRLKAIITHFLGRTTFVETIDDALRLSHREKDHNRVISLEGDVVNTWGSMVGGIVHRRNAASLINRDKELTALQNSLLEEERKLIEVEEKWKDTQTRREAAMKERENLLSRLQKEQEEERRLRETLESARMTLAAKMREQEGAKSLLAKTIDTLPEEVAEEETTLKAQEEEAIRLLRSLQEQEEESRKVIQGKEKEQAVLRHQREYLTRDLQALSERLKENREKADAFSHDDALREEQKEEARRILESSQKQIQEAEEKKKSAQKESEEALRQWEALEKEYHSQHEQAEKCMQLRQKTAERLQEENNQLFRLQMEKEQKETQRNQWLEDYRLQYDLSEEMVRERLAQLVPIDTSRKQVREIREQLSKIGYFNVEAIEQYQEMQEELDFLKQQMTDLSKSRKDIQELIRDLDATMESMFTESFRRMNEEYNRIFQLLFHGGQAHLRLDGEDVLTCGVEIEAQPPGKKLQSLNLLSGGERSMTALALLFAIFSIHPTPFCILDEIDASLDEANIGRYVEYLQSICHETQFIVITHRKSTMQLAETLYGVTMQNGLSRIVSLRFADFEDETEERSVDA